MKQHRIFAFVLLLCLALGVKAQQAVAYADSQVRFTVISDGALRLEWHPQGCFTDDPSFLAVERTYVVPPYQVKQSGSKVVITTAKLRLEYRKGSGRFTAENLMIRSLKGVNPAFQWKPGMKQQANLGGTFRTLDGMNGGERDGKKVEMPDGLLARDGWTLIDDSRNFLFDSTDWAWVKQREDKEGQDWYFLGYGHDYKSALMDYTRFAGKMPLPPRYAFGYWWSRYWAYSDHQLRQLVQDFKRYDIPLEVLVIDMDWHHTLPGKGGWTGWTWNDYLFPNPKRLLSDLHDEGLKVTLNLHPADGLAPYEQAYPAVAKALGLDAEKKEKIEWVASDKRFMTAMFDHVLHPMQKEGVSFWWLDWQQHPFDRHVDSLSNTWWINYCFFSDMQRHSTQRPMLYHRWGGLGNHRYQVGFSGDTYISWASLDYQPYFNSTASNVLYGYWSHDIGGHMLGTIEPEMYIRWLQFGCYAPIMRTHTSKGYKMNKEPWIFGAENLDIIRSYVLQRYRLVPYIYTMARKAYDEAVSLCRPLYYDYPEAAEAYSYRNEYLFGDRLLVAPITAPADSATGFTPMTIWLPEGSEWYEWHSGRTFTGGQEVTQRYALNEYPIFVKKGTLLPLYTDARRLSSNEQPLSLAVFPGEEGSFSLYEDQGDDRYYNLHYSFTPLSYRREGNQLHVTIAPRNGSFPNMPGQRQWQIEVISSAYPAEVTVNGQKAAFSYDGNQLLLTVPFHQQDTNMQQVVVITYPDAPFVATDGMPLQMARLRKAMVNLNERMPGLMVNDDLGFMEEIGQRLTYEPEQLPQLVERFKSLYSRLPEVLKSAGVSDEDTALFLKEIDYQQ